MERSSAGRGKLTRPSKAILEREVVKAIAKRPSALPPTNEIAAHTPVKKSTIWTPPYTANKKRAAPLPETSHIVTKKAKGGRRALDETSVTTDTIAHCLNHLAELARTRTLEDVLTNNELAHTYPEIEVDHFFLKYISFLLDFRFRFVSRQSCADLFKACKEPLASRDHSSITGPDLTMTGKAKQEAQLAKLYQELDKCDRSSYAAPIERRLLLSEFLALKEKMYPSSGISEKEKQELEDDPQQSSEAFEFAADIVARLHPSSHLKHVNTNAPARRRLKDVNSELMDIVFGKDSVAANSKLKRKQLIERLHRARPWRSMEDAFGAGALALIPKGCGTK